MSPFSLWEMVRGRVVAAVVAGLAAFALRYAAVELTEEHLTALAGAVDTLGTITALIVYGVVHNWRAKRALDEGKVVPSRVESFAPYPEASARRPSEPRVIAPRGER